MLKSTLRNLAVMATSLLCCAVFFYFSCSKKSTSSGSDASSNTNSIVAPSSLVARFSFNGNGNDSVGGLQPLSEGSPNFSGAGKFGSALTVAAGSYAIYSVPESSKLFSSIDTALTVSFWLKVTPTVKAAKNIFTLFPDTADKNWGFIGCCVESKDHWSLASPSNPGDTIVLKPNIQFYGTTSSSQDCLIKLGGAANSWVHVVIIASIGSDSILRYKAYQNGTFLDTATEASTDGLLRFENRSKIKVFGGGDKSTRKFLPLPASLLTKKYLTFGAWGGQAESVWKSKGEESWYGKFDGSLDEFRIYNKALTDVEVKLLYVEGLFL